MWRSPVFSRTILPAALSALLMVGVVVLVRRLAGEPTTTQGNVVWFIVGMGLALAFTVLILARQSVHAHRVVVQRTKELAASRDEVQRTLEALQEANGRLLDADQAKSDFLSTVSHELRTPLTVIQEYVDLILSGSAGSVDPDAREFLTVVRSQLDRVNRMLSELLDFARLEAESLLLRPRFVDPLDVLHRVRGFFTPAAETSRHHLHFEIPETLPRIWVDPDRLEQILGNLVSNALKFTPKWGQISVRAAAEGEELVFTVEDTGPGIPEEMQAHLFERFFQVKSMTEITRSGFGLGLSIAHALATAQGGFIEVESRSGEGSRFAVHFPVRTEEEVIELERRSLCELDPNQDTVVRAATATLPNGGDLDGLEDWIRSHTAQDGSCRVIRRQGVRPGLTVMIARDPRALPQLASRSRAVFPLVQWNPQGPAERISAA